MKHWLDFLNCLFRETTLPPRDREIAILRIGWRCQSEYVWSRHTIAGKREGLSDHEIHLITMESASDEWRPTESVLLRAVDELIDKAFITDATWNDLAKHYTARQLMDFIIIVGVATLHAMIVNSLGVQLDDDATGFPSTM